MAQHEMVLSEESEDERVVSYLTQLKESVHRLKADAQRINKYQALFKVRTRNSVMIATVFGSSKDVHIHRHSYALHRAYTHTHMPHYTQ
jgi:hypothetical protein